MTPFVPPPDFDLEKFRTRQLYSGTDAHSRPRCALRSHMARDIRERFAASDIVEETEGRSLEVHVATSSAAWLTRWALAFGTDAEVRSPAPCREHIQQVCQEALVAYSTPVVQRTKAG